MRAYVHANHAAHQQQARDLVTAGLKRHGIVILDGPEGADFVACWGWRKGREFRTQDRRVLVMEAGYVGDRLLWTSLAWDGLNGYGRFPKVEDRGLRWREVLDLADFQPAASPDGRYALVLGQVSGDMSLQGRDLREWYAAAAEDLRALYGLPVFFRPHPVEVKYRGEEAARACPSVPVINGTLEEALSGAVAAAAWNSNSLTDAALAAVPVMAGDPGAMVWPIAGQGLGRRPRLGDIERWCARLAWCQWTPEEIAGGNAWEWVREAMEPGTGWTPALAAAVEPLRHLGDVA